MAGQQTGWTKSFSHNTAYVPLHQPSPALDDHNEPAVPAYEHVSKPTEHFIHATEKDDDQDRHHLPQTFYQAHFGGLRRTLRFFLSIAILVLLINISWLAYASTHYGGLRHGYGSIQQGECNAAKRTNTWLHLLINILSTLLLTGSNAFMSTYCCPSRGEVDEAHKRRKWLHVGMLSWRNLRGVAKRKAVVVVVLALTSVPFHLLYNSLVFVSLTSNNYYWNVVDEAFLTGAPYNLTGPLYWSGGMRARYFTIPSTPDGEYTKSFAYLPDHQKEVDQLYAYYDGIQRNASSWERLSNRDCIQAYSNLFLADRRNLILVSSTKNETDSLLTYDVTVIDRGSLDQNWWICSRARGNDGGNLRCQPETLLSNAENWTVFDYPIEYCLSERVEGTCEVKFSLIIMAIVIVFNAAKVIAMTWVLCKYDAEHLLTTVGDAAASFLLRPDDTTRGMCLADRKTINKVWAMPGTGIPYSGRRHRWATAVSRGKWITFSLLMAVAFGLILFFGAWGFSHLKNQRGVSLALSSLWRLGFGAPHQDAIVIYDIHTTGTLDMALMANIPQLFLAVVWLLYMGIMTTMFLSANWAQFGTNGQTLQVSSPVGQQRGSWLLGAPPIYGVGLLVLQIILHWLVSQSIFVISMAIRTPDGSVPPHTMKGFVNAGFSPMGIIFSLIVSGLLVISVLGMAMRQFPLGAAPIVATNSAAISAACHMPPELDQYGVLYEPLRWGQNGEIVHGVAHCSLMPAGCFSSGKGQPPTAGWHYAGLPGHNKRASSSPVM